MRATLALALALALALPAVRAAGEIVQLRDVHVPDRTAADHPFPLFVNVTNHDTQVRHVYLFAALYEPGTTPCGAATDPRFKAFTPLVQASLDVRAGATVPYPTPGDAWLQRYQTEDVPTANATMELCVFVAEDSSAETAQLRYDDYASRPLATRGVNHAPVASFGTTNSGRSYRFQAQASDADGDPLTDSWRIDTGADPAFFDGPIATYSFAVPGAHDITLRVSDGFDTTTTTTTLVVATVSSSTTTPPSKSVPLPWALTPVALLLALASRPSRRAP